MAVISKIKITAVNKPKGTMTVMFNGDNSLEWNYNIPFDDEGNPIEGDELVRYLIAASYENIKAIQRSRAENDLRNATNYDKFNALHRKEIDVRAIVTEYEEVVGTPDSVG